MVMSVSNAVRRIPFGYESRASQQVKRALLEVQFDDESA